MRSHVKLFSLLTMIFVLSGCSTLDQAYYGLMRTGGVIAGEEKSLIRYQQCPSVYVVEDLSQLYKFAPADVREAENLQSHVVLTMRDSQCVYDTKSVSVDVTLDFAGSLGPKGRFRAADEPLVTHPFFVAIADRGGDVLAKQIFAASLHYKEGLDKANYTETIRQIIPVEGPKDGKEYAVMVGFQLEDNDLYFNRAKARLDRAQAAKTAKEAKKAKKSQKVGEVAHDVHP